MEETAPSQESGHKIYEDMTKVEKRFADFLDKLNLIWYFEQPVFIEDEKYRPRVWIPDFFLVELGVYVEVHGDWGTPEKRNKNYEYRKKIYEKNDIPVIFVPLFGDTKLWQKNFVEELIKIHEDRDFVMDDLRERFSLD